VARVPRLSKSRFQAGLQCPKHLWLLCHAYQLADPVTDSQQAVFDQGHAVGALAREYFPGGALVGEDHLHCFEALRTTEHLRSEGFSCLYEPAFEHDGVLVRSDVVVKDDCGVWTLVEVKSSTEVKPEHITDLGIQAYVLRESGIALAGCRLLHINNAYVHPGGPYDLGQLFTLADVTAEVEQFLPEVPGLIRQMKELLVGPCPDVQISKRCEQPYTCRFHGHCHDYLPEFPVTEIPRVSNEVLCGLIGDGYCSIREVPLDYPGLTPLQRTVCDVIQSGEARFGPGLEGELGALVEPMHFLDFETFRAALPVYVGTRPYQAVPVQWSCHTLDGSLGHQEFLHTDSTDPRRAFATSLLSALPGEGRIVVYSSYENTILASLARDLPDLAESIAALQARLFDLEKVVRAHVQHPDFHGRTSLKYVLPALADDLSYQGLAVPNGDVATLRYGQAVFGECCEAEREAILGDLLAYCRTDTLALVRVYEELLKAS
jgi:hypothetical protein